MTSCPFSSDHIVSFLPFSSRPRRCRLAICLSRQILIFHVLMNTDTTTAPKYHPFVALGADEPVKVYIPHRPGQDPPVNASVDIS